MLARPLQRPSPDRLPCALPTFCRAKHQARGAVYEQILKKNEQMYALLAVVTALCPTANRLLDEAVAATLREKYGEKVRGMQAGSTDTYEELFTYACPKYVATTGLDLSNPAANANMDAFRTQLRWVQVCDGQGWAAGGRGVKPGDSSTCPASSSRMLLLCAHARAGRS